MTVCGIALASACRQNDDPAGAEELLAQVQQEDYRSWEPAPGYEERQPSTAPHGGNSEIFVNDVMAEALEMDGLTEWPEGSIVAKDGYTDDGDLDVIALMEKRGDGWYWAEYSGEGEVLFSGAPTICTDCHGSGSDFVRAFAFP
jgi:hypothetical protein